MTGACRCSTHRSAPRSRPSPRPPRAWAAATERQVSCSSCQSHRGRPITCQDGRSQRKKESKAVFPVDISRAHESRSRSHRVQASSVLPGHEEIHLDYSILFTAIVYDIKKKKILLYDICFRVLDLSVRILWLHGLVTIRTLLIKQYTKYN